MAHTGSGTIQRARHALTFDNLVGYIGPILLAVILAAWRAWRHFSGAKEREEWRQWQRQICESFEQAQQELGEIKEGQKAQGEKIDTIGEKVQKMEGRFEQMDSQS